MESREHSSRETAESTAARFIAHRDTGPWTEADAQSLQLWLGQSASHRVAYYRLDAAWQEAGRAKALGAGRAETLAAPERESALPEPGAHANSARDDSLDRPPARRRGQRTYWAALAASLVLTALGLSAWYRFSDARNRYSTAIGVTETIPLADESRVLLNTNSAIHVSLTTHERLIQLDRGEAYFEVAHDPTRPFIVQADGHRVVAVGTQFAVRRDRNTLQVSVTEGTVRLEKEGDPPSSEQSSRTPREGTATQQEILLSAGSVARIQSDALLLRKQPVADVEQSLSRRAGVLTFRDTPLAEAVAEFNRYNTRKIVIQDPSIANLQVGGMFRANNIEPFVHLIEQGLPLQATQEGEEIRLTARH